MHLLIDIRSQLPDDSIRTQYAIRWATLWHEMHPTDTMSYIAFDTQDVGSAHQVTRVSPPRWHTRKKKLTLTSSHEIFRCINFSRYAPYDSRIPTVSHIFDERTWLYPTGDEGSFLKRREFSRTMHSIIRHSAWIIVPSLSTGNELVELWQAREDRIEIVPYISYTHGTTDAGIFSRFGIPTRYVLHDATIGKESNVRGLLQAWSLFAEQDESGTDLVIHGTIGSELREITDMIRELGLIDRVKLIGTLTFDGLETLYAHAIGWIYVGSYYAGGPAIELAASYGLPCLLSDIDAFNGYKHHAIVIHPNHLDTLADALGELISMKKNTAEEKTLTRDIMRLYERILAEEK